MTVEVPDAEPNGLAAIIADLIRANLDRDPERAALLRPAVVRVRATDIGLGATIGLRRGHVAVTNKTADGAKPAVVVTTDAATLMELSHCRLRLGFPDIFSSEGRAIIAKLLRKRLRVKGLARHPLVVARLNRLLSVS